MKEIRLTKEECEVLVNLLDIAVKAAGLQAAHAAHLLALKVRGAKDVGESEDSK